MSLFHEGGPLPSGINTGVENCDFPTDWLSGGKNSAAAVSPGISIEESGKHDIENCLDCRGDATIFGCFVGSAGLPS